MCQKPVRLLGLAVVGTALVVTLANCGSSAPAVAAHPSATQVALGAPPSQRPGRQLSPSARPRFRGGDGTQASTSPRSTAPGPPPPPSPAPIPRGGPLPGGLYVGVADGAPHYIIALSLGAHDAIAGSVTFLYQDGRTATVGRYTGRMFPSGKLTLDFNNGKTMVGAYRRGMLAIANCRTVLAWSADVAGCQFSYHGHVP